MTTYLSSGASWITEYLSLAGSLTMNVTAPQGSAGDMNTYGTANCYIRTLRDARVIDYITFVGVPRYSYGQAWITGEYFIIEKFGWQAPGYVGNPDKTMYDMLIHTQTVKLWPEFGRTAQFDGSCTMRDQKGEVGFSDVAWVIPQRPYFLPDSPINVSANVYSNSHVQITWAAGSNNYWNPSHYYVLLRRDDSNGAWIELTRGDSATWFNDYSVKPNRTYEYVVVAGNSSGTGGWSVSASVVIAIGPKIWYNNAWRGSIPYIYHNNAWVEATPYIRNSNAWKQSSI